MTARRGPIKGVRHSGFALPLVIVLAATIALLVASMLERQTGQSITVHRQIMSYRETHFGRGVREVVDSWLRSNASRSIRDALGTDGKALDLELGDGTTLTLYMTDAQGTVLSTRGGLLEDEAQDLRAIREIIAESEGIDQLRRFTRTAGPSSISIMSAPIEVLTALATHVTGGSASDECLRELLAIRDKPAPTQKDLSDAAQTLGLDELHRAKLMRLCAVEPTYYSLRLDARTAGSSPDAGPIARYEATVRVPTPSSMRGRTTTGIKQRTNFLTWRKVDLD